MINVFQASLSLWLLQLSRLTRVNFLPTLSDRNQGCSVSRDLPILLVSLHWSPPWMVTWLLPTSFALLPPLSPSSWCSLGLPSLAPSPCSMNHSSHLSPHSSALKSLTFPSFLWMHYGAYLSNWHSVTQCMVKKNTSSESKMFISLMFQVTVLIDVISFLESWAQWEFTQSLSWMSLSLSIFLCLPPIGNFHLMFQHKFLLHEQFFLLFL